MNISALISVFIGEIVFLFFLSRLALRNIYPILRKTVKKDSYIITLISLFYIPGTIIHELSHYIVALLLYMHPREISFFPTIEDQRLRLGYVLYEKRKGDFIRPIIIGIAPIIGGLLSLWVLIQFKLFPGEVWWHTGLSGYLIIAITANMFSSKQDLIDAGYLIPLGFLVFLLSTLIPIQISPVFMNQILSYVSFFITTIQLPLLFSLAFHAILVLALSRLK
jgi:hypothetical protein